MLIQHDLNDTLILHFAAAMCVRYAARNRRGDFIPVFEDQPTTIIAYRFVVSPTNQLSTCAVCHRVPAMQ
jgi:hypothetical protein